ncbi:MAG: ribonuclease HII [Candidatus Kerfeldbacteria bacterium]
MLFPHTREEKALRKAGHVTIAGCDEVGRGAWAGPVVAAAVVLPERFSVKGVRDSKQLSPAARERLFVRITKNALSWAVGVVSHDTIDRIGIQKANTKAIEQSLKKLHVEPDAVLIDAVKVKFGKKTVKAIIKGDVKVLSIAAASIVAKVVRDTLMKGFDREHPGYGFWKHVGYGTADHRKKLKKLGLSKIHRRSFVPMKHMR